MPRYYKTGLEKLPATGFEGAVEEFTDSVLTVFESNARKAGMSNQVIKKHVKLVAEIEKSHQPPAPTPTPYQAFVPLPLARAALPAGRS